MQGNQPDQFFGEQQAPHFTTAYCYVLRHDNGDFQYFAGWNEPIEMINLPDEIHPDNAATFLPTQIRHGKVESNDRFESRGVQLTVDSNNARLQRFLLMAAAVRIRCWIIKIAQEAIGDVVDFQSQALITQMGILSKFSFSGPAIAAELTPEPFYVDHGVPRYYCQAQCNHALYGAGCRLDREDFAFTTTIISASGPDREIILAGRKVGVAENYFEAGMFWHVETGMYFAVPWSAFEGVADTKLKLGYWHPELVAGGHVTAYAGCRHTIGDCRDKFANHANFGGFQYIPAVNPAMNGVGR